MVEPLNAAVEPKLRLVPETVPTTALPLEVPFAQAITTLLLVLSYAIAKLALEAE